ncbi:MAG: glycosyltransferase, partial [Psychroserpens sp.]|nr:glycosyltransferase [Psychroserpens sp.]
MPLVEILLYCFIFIVVIQLAYYGFIYGKLASFKPTTPNQKNIGISVLVCAKNEADNLTKNIPQLLNQTYPKFEIVLINDDSTDETLSIMKAFQSKSDLIKLVDVKPIEKFWGNKKYALTLGIKAATYDYLLFTDADCTPLSEDWISEMSKHFSNEKSIVIGYSPYCKIKNSLLNLLIRFETFMTGVQYFSYALIGIPYMAVGRNLAYKKALFFEANGFMNHMDLKSGDDDLFVNQVATKKNIELCISNKAFTESAP